MVVTLRKIYYSTKYVSKPSVNVLIIKHYLVGRTNLKVSKTQSKI